MRNPATLTALGKSATTAADGRALAIALLRAIEQAKDSEGNADTRVWLYRKFRPKGEPQNNIAAQFIRAACEGSPEFAEGFSSVITEILFSVTEGSVPDSEELQESDATGALDHTGEPIPVPVPSTWASFERACGFIPAGVPGAKG